MNARIIRHRFALRDLDEISRYLRRNGGPKQAIKFLRDAQATISRLADRPGLGVLDELGDPACVDLRCSPVSRFRNFVVFYRPIPGGIEVLRVLHGARDLDSIMAEDPDDDGT